MVQSPFTTLGQETTWAYSTQCSRAHMGVFNTRADNLGDGDMLSCIVEDWEQVHYVNHILSWNLTRMTSIIYQVNNSIYSLTANRSSSSSSSLLSSAFSSSSCHRNSAGQKNFLSGSSMPYSQQHKTVKLKFYKNASYHMQIMHPPPVQSIFELNENHILLQDVLTVI